MQHSWSESTLQYPFFSSCSRRCWSYSLCGDERVFTTAQHTKHTDVRLMFWLFPCELQRLPTLPQSSRADSLCRLSRSRRLSRPSFRLRQESRRALESSLWGDGSTSFELIKDRKATGFRLASWFPLRPFFETREEVIRRVSWSPSGQEEASPPLVKPQTDPPVSVFMTSHWYGCYTWNMSEALSYNTACERYKLGLPRVSG